MTLFQDNNEPTTVTFESLLERYGDNQTLANAVSEKDRFIEQLKRENAGMRVDLEGKIKQEQFIDRVESFLSKQNNQGAPSPDEMHNNGNQSSSTPVTMKDIEHFMEQRENQRRMSENLSQVERTLSETLGPNFGSKIKQRAADLGMSEEQLTNFAATNPKAFMQLIVTQTQQSSFEPPPQNRMNTQFTPTVKGPPKKLSDYEELRKKNRAEYWSPRIQNEIMKYTSEYGDDFLNN